MRLPRLQLRRLAENTAASGMAMSLQWRALRQSAAITTRESCLAMMNALLAINVEKAKLEMSSARRLSAGLAAAGIALILIWVILCVVRFRVLRRRLSRLLTDFACALIAGTATVLFAVSAAMSSNKRQYEFYKAPLAALKDGTGPNTPLRMTSFFRKIPVLFTDACIKIHGNDLRYTPEQARHFKKAMDIISSATSLTLPTIYVVAISLSIVAMIMILASVVSAVLAGCVKAAPEEEAERTWTAPPRVSRQAPGPSYQFFQRFLEPVTAPPEGVFGARENGDCRICLEVLMDDMSRLTACSHTFHTKCVVQWLVEADKPCCPLCKEPVRLVQR